MTALTLRVKTKQGQHVVKSLSTESAVKQLKEVASDFSKIPESSIRILLGFPPQAVDLSDELCSLGTLGVRSGDTLLVEEDVQAKQGAENQRNEQILRDVESRNKAGGFLTRQVVPANNSCLFTSINYVMENRDKLDLKSAKPMRELIAGIVMSDPAKYNEAYLGRDNASYCEWILQDESWGGAIEIAILCEHYRREIAVVDTQTGRIDRYGEDKQYTDRVLLIYDGIHYDPLAFEKIASHGDEDALRNAHGKQTIFSTADDSVLGQAIELAAEAKSSRQFTDTSRFTLRCLVCQKCLTGQTEAQEHAKRTGHINFGEV